MCMQLRSMTFHFKNGEYLTLDGKYIIDFLVRDIQREIKCDTKGIVTDKEVAENFIVAIDGSANDIDTTDTYWDGWKIFDRLSCDDIIKIEFVSYDSLKTYTYDYLVKWLHDDNDKNILQHCYTDDDGKFSILISGRF